MSDAPRQRAPKGGVRVNGKFYRGGALLPRSENKADYRRRTEPGQISRDPAYGIPDAPPNFGRSIVPHVLTFAGVTGTLAKVYRNPDEAIRNSLENARIMRSDCSIMECLEARQRVTALLNWHLEPEDKDSGDAQELCDKLTNIMRRIPQFTEYRRNLLEALWYGRYAVENTYGIDYSTGRRRYVVRKWLPIHGDKLVFRYDDGSGKYDPEEIGIRVGTSLSKNDHLAGDRELEPTDQGLAYILEPWERTRLTLHRHMIEDGPWEDPLSAGSIHGVGIRSRIYWTWFQAQETLAQLMEVVERTGQGFYVYYYPMGNPEAQAEVEAVAKKQGRTNVILMPYDPANPDAFTIQKIEANVAGMDALKDMLISFFGHRIKRYILGQILSSESEATGLGSGVAELHERSLNDIARYDATKLEESITTDLLIPIKNFNYPMARNIGVRFVIDTESPQSEKKLAAVRDAFDMGARIKEQDVMDLIGFSMPAEGDRVLQNPQIQQQQRLWDRQYADPENESTEDTTTDPNSPEHLFGPLANGGDGEAGGLSPDDGPDGGLTLDGPPARFRKARYAAASPMADPTAEHQVGETKTEGGKTYRLNERHRWERTDDDGRADPQSVSPAADDVDLAALQTAAKANLDSVDKPIGGLMRALQESPEFAESGTHYGRDVHPELAEQLYEWMADNMGQNVGGGRVVNLGNGRLGFASAAGSLVLKPTDKGDWQASYTVDTGPVREAASGGEPDATPEDTVVEDDPEPTEVEPDRLEADEAVTAPVADSPAQPPNSPQKTEPSDTGKVTAPPLDPARFRETADRAELEYEQAIQDFDDAVRTGGDTKEARKRVTAARVAWREAQRIARDAEKQAAAKAEANPVDEFVGPPAARKMAVKRALAEGRDVPAEVLADYPELQPEPDDDFDQGEDDDGQATLPVGDKPKPTAPAPTPRPTAAQRLTGKLDEFIAGSGLDMSEAGREKLREAIERGALDTPAKLRRLLKTAGRLHERAGSIGSTDEAVQEAIRRAVNRAERPKKDELLAEVAAEYEVDQRDLAEAVEHLLDVKGREHDEREAAKEAARLATGLTARDIARFENQGVDHAADHPKLKSLAVVGRSLASEFPGIFGGTGYDEANASDEADYAASVWDLLREGKQAPLTRTDPDLLREAAELVQSGGGMPNLTPEQQAELDAIPFRKRLGMMRKAVYRRTPSAKAVLRSLINEAAAQTERNPSEAQRDAGNYTKGHVRLHGLDIAIENAKGTKRRPEWKTLPHHYGYIKRTEGNDGDHVDVFLGPDPDSEVVFVVDQIDEAGVFDEHKVMLGWKSEADAVDAYKSAYQDGWKVGPVTALTVEQFNAWLELGEMDWPVADQVSRYAKWEEENHPRGQPDNAGQFAEKEGVATDSQKPPTAIGDELPEGWYVHGRNGRQDLDTGNVIQMTRDWDIAEQYAGKRGSVWAIRFSPSAKMLDLESDDERMLVASAMLDDYADGKLSPGMDDIITNFEREGGTVESLADTLEIPDIVDSAGWLDNAEFASWLWDRFEYSGALVDGGAVVLDIEETETHKI